MKNWLEQQYPELRGSISGANFPAPPRAVMLAQFAQVLQMAGIALALFGDGLLGLVGIKMPEFVKENRLMIFGMLFLFNTVAQNMMATGAFEITMNGKRIYSKIESGRMPTLHDLVARFEDAGLTSVNSPAFSNRQV